MVAVAVVLLVGWVTGVLLVTGKLDDNALEAEVSENGQWADQMVDVLAFHTQQRIDVLRSVAERWATNPKVLIILAPMGSKIAPSPLDEKTRRAAWLNTFELLDFNREQARVAQIFDVDAVSVLNAAGDTIASSTFDKEGNLVGINRGYRAYFRTVMSGKTAVEHIWGRSLASITEDPTSFVEAIHPEDRPHVVTQLRDGGADGQPFELEYRVVRPDGSIISIRYQGFPVRGASDRVTQYVGIARDITGTRQAEDLLRAKSRAEAANDAKAMFLANMSHEIRTPMNAVLGFSHLALQTREPSKRRDYLLSINIAAKELLHTLNDILDWLILGSGVVRYGTKSTSCPGLTRVSTWRQQSGN